MINVDILKNDHTSLKLGKKDNDIASLQCLITSSSNVETKKVFEIAKSDTKFDITSDSQEILFLRVGSAVFYGVASMMIMVINKRILTVYAFPSFQVLGLGQMIAIIMILWIGRCLNIIDFPKLSGSVLTKVWPLPLLYTGNMMLGLAGTQALSLPMMIVLRRFTVLMTMAAEFFILKIKPGLNVQVSVLMMIFGAFVAAVNDLAFNLLGYSYILMSNICSSINAVTTKKKLNAKDLGKYGLLFYNSLLMLPLTILISYVTGDIDSAYNYKGWRYINYESSSDLNNSSAFKQTQQVGDNGRTFSDTESINIAFLFHFLLSCIFGFILMFATLLCTLHNSALTTMVIGSLKNIVITYLGMFVGGDYIFSWWNFIGINISAIAALNYARITFRGKIDKNNKQKNVKQESIVKL